MAAYLDGIALYLAWGTGAGTAGATDTGLFTEDTTAGYARVAATKTLTTLNIANDTLQCTGTINAANSGAAINITEVAIYDALTGGNCLYHRTFGSAVAVQQGGSNTGIKLHRGSHAVVF